MGSLCFLLSICLASMSLLWSFTAKGQCSQGLLFIHTWEGSGLVKLVNCRHFLKRFWVVYFLSLWSFPTGWTVLSSPGICCFFCLFVNMLSSSIKLFPFPWNSYDLKAFPTRWKVLNSEEDLLETVICVVHTGLKLTILLPLFLNARFIGVHHIVLFLNIISYAFTQISFRQDWVEISKRI